MISNERQSRNASSRRLTYGAACPACGGPVAADAKWCASCNFTGVQTVDLFPDAPPPLMPIFDAAGIWSQPELKKIEAARQKLRRRFPQFHFHVCTVMLPAETSLPVFGFWLLNASPLYINETVEDRSWTVLLLINARSGQAAVVPCYAAEHWVSDEDWMKILASMSPAWKAGKTARAMVRYFESSAAVLDQTWKIRGARNSKRSMS